MPQCTSGIATRFWRGVTIPLLWSRVQRLLRAVWPSVPEPIDVAAYRRGFTVAWTCALLPVLNVCGYYAFRDVPGTASAGYRRFLWAIVPCHLACVAVAVLARRFLLTERALRAATYALIVAFLLSCTIAVWSSGGSFNVAFNVNTTIMMLLVAWVRGYYDAWLGLFALSVAVTLLVALQVVEATGSLATAPWLVAQANPFMSRWSGRLVGLAWQSSLVLLSWIGTSYVIKRLRETDWALAAERSARRKLEQRIADQDGGKLAGMTLHPGYALRELLGHGAMGEVYEAKRTGDGAVVAVKVLHAHLAASSEMISRFRREAAILGRLPRSCAARIFDDGVTAEGQPFLVMERLRGEDLAAFLRRRPYIPAAEALPILRALAVALDSAHQAGVVHRDLKPQNVFLLDDTIGDGPAVRLLDFGISRLLDDESPLTRPAWVLGSPGFLAPEQARGALDRIGPHSDVFALGAIAYRMLTGQRAFPARDMTGAVFEAIHAEPPPPSAVRPELGHAVDAVFTLALAKAIESRYRRPSDFTRDLALALDGALPESVAQRARAATSRDAADRTLSGAAQAHVAVD
jgi:hypothetical protein